MSTTTPSTSEFSRKQLQEFLLFAFTLQAILTEFLRKKTKKIKWLQAFKFMPLIPTIEPAFNDLGNPLEQYKNLTLADREKLHQYFITEFDLPNNEIEQLIEEAIGIAAVNVEFVRSVTAVVRPSNK